MFLVAFIACILKKPSLDEEDTNEDLNNVIAAHDEEFIGKDNGTIEGLSPLSELLALFCNNAVVVITWRHSLCHRR